MSSWRLLCRRCLIGLARREAGLDQHYHQEWMAIAGIVGRRAGLCRFFRLAAGYLKNGR